MTTKISKVANLALQVFNQHSGRASSVSGGLLSLSSLPKDKLNQLIILLNKIDGRDVGFDATWINATTKADGSNVCAPVLYVHIMENEIFSLGIFVLRPGSRIPLHDHPNMFGLVKVIHGNVRCRSFTRVFGNKPMSSFTPLLPRLSKWQINDLIATTPHQDTVIEAKSEAMLLSPSEGNFHELFTVGNEGAAFVDILAPPYDHFLGQRECHFYQEISIPRPISPQNGFPQSGGGSNNNSNHSNSESSPIDHNDAANNTNYGPKGDERSQQYVYLIETHQPKDYWCDSAEYRGPRVL